MMKTVAILMITILAAVSAAAQTSAPPSKAEVLAKLDANAKTFKSLDASIERREWDNLTKKVATTDSGKIYFQTTKSNPRIKMEIIEPKKSATSALIDNGKYELYESATNTVRGGTVSNNDVLELLLIGFGVTSEKIQKSFNVETPTLETFNGETVVMVDLRSKEPQPRVTAIRLWLSRKDWSPLKIELTMPDKDTWTITYKAKKLNSNLSGSTFKLNVPRDAKRY